MEEAKKTGEAKEEEKMRASKDEVNDKYYDEENDDEFWERYWQQAEMERDGEVDIIKKVKVGKTVKEMDIQVTIYVSTNKIRAKIRDWTNSCFPVVLFEVCKRKETVIARILLIKNHMIKWSVVSLDLKEKDFDKIREKVLGIIGDYPIKIINIVRAVKFLSKKMYSLCNIDLKSKNLLQLDGKLTIKRKYEDNCLYTY